MTINRVFASLLRALGLAAILFCCYMAQVQFLVAKSEAGYLWLGAAGLVALLVIAPAARPNLAALDPGTLDVARGWRRWLGLLLFIPAAVLLVHSVPLMHADLLISPSVTEIVLLEYVGGVGLALLGGLLLAGVGRLPRPDSTMQTLVGILALAVFLRVYNLSDYPFGVWYDEGLLGMRVRDMLTNPAFRPLFIDNTSLPMLTMYAHGLQAYGVSNVAGMRIVPALLSTLGVLVAYLVGRELRGAWFGVAMAFMLAIMRWAIDFGRFGTTGIEVVTFTLLTIYTAIRFVRYGRLRDALWFGVALGAGFYFYRPYQLQLIAVGLYLLISYPFLRRRWSRTLVLIVTAAAAALLVLLPIGLFALDRSEEFFGRVGAVSIFNEQMLEGVTVTDAIVQNTIKHLEMFHLQGDRNGRHNLPYAPMLDPVMGSLMAIGLFVALREWRKEHLLFFASLLVGLASGIFSVTFEAPQAARSMSAITGVAYFAALGLAGMTRLIIDIVGAVVRDRERYGARLVAGAAALAAVVVMSAWNIDVYFNQQRVNPDVWKAHSTDSSLTARFYRDYDEQTQFFVSPLIGITPSMEFIAEDALSRSQAFLMPDPFPLRVPPTTHAVIMLLPGEDYLVDYLREIYPGAKVTSVRPYDYDVNISPDDTLFTVVELQPEVVASVQGLQAGEGVLYAPRYDGYTFSFEDGVGLEIDGADVENGAVLQLAEGNHHIRVRPEDAQVRWQYSGAPEGEPIPGYDLYHAPVTLNGLLATYYANGDWQGDPVLQKVVPEAYLYIHIIPLERPYSTRYTGYLYAPTTGDYEFVLDARDTGAFDIDGENVLNAAPGNSGRTTITLEQGWHPIELSHQDLTGSTSIYLSWKPPGSDAVRMLTRDYLCPDVEICPTPESN